MRSPPPVLAVYTKLFFSFIDKTLVPSLHSEELNPYIDFKQSPFYVQHQTEEWKQPVMIANGSPISYPRRAGVSSFGATGSNAHVILEEYLPLETASSLESNPINNRVDQAIIPLSAKNKERLQSYAKKVLDFLLSFNNNPGEYKNDEQVRLRNIVEAEIRKILAGIFQIKEEMIETEADWNEYGIAPVQLVGIRNQINAKWGIDLQELNQKSSVKSVVNVLIDSGRNILAVYYHSQIITQPTVAAPPPSVNQEPALADLAYTLQVGRVALEERVAFLVKDIPELITKLKAFTEGQNSFDRCWWGEVKRSKEIADFFNADQDSLELIQKWITKGSLHKIAELWVKGMVMDWELLYRRIKPRRIILPSYPFAKESYWAPRVEYNRNFTGINMTGVQTIPSFIATEYFGS